MKVMGWSWTDLQETPAYVRRVAWDFEQAQRRADSQRMKKAGV